MSTSQANPVPIFVKVFFDHDPADEANPWELRTVEGEFLCTLAVDNAEEDLARSYAKAVNDFCAAIYTMGARPTASIEAAKALVAFGKAEQPLSTYAKKAPR